MSSVGVNLHPNVLLRSNANDAAAAGLTPATAAAPATVVSATEASNAAVRL
jgi:hypothetical protein